MIPRALLGPLEESRAIEETKICDTIMPRSSKTR